MRAENHDWQKRILDLLSNFVEQNRHRYPMWVMDVGYDARNHSAILQMWCGRPCCGDSCPFEVRHGVRFSCSMSSGRTKFGGVDLMVEGVDFNHGWLLEPPVLFVPPGSPVEDIFEVVREQLDLIPVCIEGLESDTIYWEDRQV